MQKTMRIVANVFNIAVMLVLWVYLVLFMVKDGLKLFTLESPLVFSFIVAVGLTVLITINIFLEVSKAKAAAKASGGKPAAQGGNVLKELAPVGIFAAATFVYILLLRYLHFIAGSIIFMTLGMYLLNEVDKKFGPRFLKAGIACIITVPILYFTFSGLFGLILP